ncbi:MAG: hypothetical protein VX199_02590 [Chloroflexota bacterium]|nr:hypothetical protein [Chloroflexota bacterium]
MGYLGNFRAKPSSIVTADIAAGQITTALIADDGITAAKIADDAVVSAAIGANQIGSSELNLGANYAFTGTVTGAGGGKILQVVQAFKSDTFSTTTYNSWIDITGLSLNITPASTSSTILLTAYIGCVADTRLNLATVFRFMRGSTAVGVAATAGNRFLATFGGQNVMADANHGTSKGAATYLDSPNSTSQQTYKLQMNTQSGGSHTIYINRTVNDGDSANNYLARRSSGIIAMEVSG